MALLISRLLSCRVESLPYNFALMAKVLAVMLLVSRAPLKWPGPFLPFLPILDLPPIPATQVVKALGILALVAIVLRVKLRLMCVAAGTCALITVLWNRVGYENNILFYGLMLLMLGLDWRLIRWQLVIVYVGAMLDKLLDADWRSGQFFDHWARAGSTSTLRYQAYAALADTLPPLAAGKLFSWATIITEVLLAVGFSVRRLWPYAIPLALAFHLALTVMNGPKLRDVQHGCLGNHARVHTLARKTHAGDLRWRLRALRCDKTCIQTAGSRRNAELANISEWRWPRARNQR